MEFSPAEMPNIFDLIAAVGRIAEEPYETPTETAADGEAAARAAAKAKTAELTATSRRQGQMPGSSQGVAESPTREVAKAAVSGLCASVFGAMKGKKKEKEEKPENPDGDHSSPDPESSDNSESEEDGDDDTLASTKGSWDHLRSGSREKKKGSPGLRRTYERQLHREEKQSKRMKEVAKAIERGLLNGDVPLDQYLQFETMRSLLKLHQRKESEDAYPDDDFRPGGTKVMRGITGFRKYRDSISRNSLAYLEAFDGLLEESYSVTHPDREMSYSDYGLHKINWGATKSLSRFWQIQANILRLLKEGESAQAAAFTAAGM